VWEMPDEYIWVIIKASAVVLCSTLILLCLAWIANKKCFSDKNDVPLEKHKDRRAVDSKAKKPTAA
jgi:hypothetical protein